MKCKTDFCIPAVLFLAFSLSSAGLDTHKYIEENGVVIVEAVDLDYQSANWGKQSAKGRDYLSYLGGGGRHCPSDLKDDHNNDVFGKCQGEPQTWLRVPVQINTVGLYIIDLWNIHFKEDGDNDVWTHIEDYPPKVYRCGSHHPNEWGWLSWGPHTPGEASKFGIKEKGLYVFYVSGRSKGFGVGRIHIYRKTGKDSYADGYHSVSAPVTQKVPIGSTETARTARLVDDSYSTLTVKGSTWRLLSTLPGDEVRIVNLQGKRFGATLGSDGTICTGASTAPGIKIVSLIRNGSVVESHRVAPIR